MKSMQPLLINPRFWPKSIQTAQGIFLPTSYVEEHTLMLIFFIRTLYTWELLSTWDLVKMLMISLDSFIV